MNKVYNMDSEKELMITEAHVCPYGNFNCNGCYYFDSSYHGGYCDKHRVDTSPGNYCGDWVSK